jgi:hypothetical protein
VAANPIKLYVDECVHSQAAQAFRNVGWDAVGAHESGNLTLSDPEQLEFAASEGRAFITYNVCDFVPLYEEWLLIQRDHPGIILSPIDYKQRVGALVRDVRSTLKEDASIQGGVEVDGEWIRNHLVWVRRFGSLHETG